MTAEIAIPTFSAACPLCGVPLETREIRVSEEGAFGDWQFEHCGRDIYVQATDAEYDSWIRASWAVYHRTVDGVLGEDAPMIEEAPEPIKATGRLPCPRCGGMGYKFTWTREDVSISNPYVLGDVKEGDYFVVCGFCGTRLPTEGEE